jgi:glutathione S-transferase
MIIYGASLSPFVRKVLAMAAEKGLDVEHRVPPPGQPDPDFLAASPFRKVPALKDGDFMVCDSSAIAHYLEAIKPDPALIPTSAQDRARTIWFDEFADTILVGAAGKIFFNRIVAPRFMGQPGDQALADAAEQHELPPVLDYLERTIPESGFLVCDRLTLADLAVASPFANIRHLGLDLSRWPRTQAWAEAMLDRPSFGSILAKEARFLSR